MPSQLWAETDREMVEGRPEGEGELATENPEEQQHAEHQSSPSPRQWKVSQNYILLLLVRKTMNVVVILYPPQLHMQRQ